MAQATGFDYLRAFDEAAERVFQEILGETPAKGPPVVSAGPTQLQAVNVNIGIAGALAGHFRLGMDDPTARALAGAMLGEDVTELDEMSLSALCEVANMIAGSARSSLTHEGALSEITPPSILLGQGLSESWYNLRTVSVPLTLGAGVLFLTVGIRANFKP